MKHLIIIVLACLLCAPASAQKRKTTKKVEVVKTAEELLYEELLPSCAKIMFIDSMVVDKALFLSSMKLPSNVGRLSAKGAVSSHTDEFYLTRVSAEGDSLTRALYISRRFGNDWEKERLFDSEVKMPDYPFMSEDGVTLYFSAEGEGTVGGRDIFRTTYDTEEFSFYEPVNVGLPFNSPANDYLLAISDYDNLGWLVSDRHQEEGKVCVYTFQPQAQRVVFGEDADTAAIKEYVELRSVEDTWGYGDIEAARTRQKQMHERIDGKRSW